MKYFHINEFFPNCSASERNIALSNADMCDNMIKLLQELDLLRDRLGFALTINSGFRNSSHNALVGGSPTSQHLVCSAVDVRPTSKSISVDRIVKELCKHSYNFGQVIIYSTFVHIALPNYKYRQLSISYHHD